MSRGIRGAGQSVPCHRRIAHGVRRAGAQARRYEIVRRDASVCALMDLDRGVEVQLSRGTGEEAPETEPGGTVNVEWEIPPTEAASGVIQNLFARLPTSHRPGWETRTFLDRGTETPAMRFHSAGDLVNYFIESAYVWTELFDGYRVEELMEALFPSFSAEVRNTAVLAMKYCQRPRWPAAEVAASVDAVAKREPGGTSPDRRPAAARQVHGATTATSTTTGRVPIDRRWTERQETPFGALLGAVTLKSIS